MSDVVVSDAAETSHMSNNYKENEYENFFEEWEQTVIEVPVKEKVSNKGIMITFHQNRKSVRYQTQALSELAGGMRSLVESHS